MGTSSISAFPEFPPLMFVETSGVAEFVAAAIEVCGCLVELVEAFDLALEPCLSAAVVVEQVVDGGVCQGSYGGRELALCRGDGVVGVSQAFLCLVDGIFGDEVVVDVLVEQRGEGTVVVEDCAIVTRESVRCVD